MKLALKGLSVSTPSMIYLNWQLSKSAKTQCYQKYVDAFSNGGGKCDDSVCAGDSVEATDEVGQVVEDGQIVLHHDDVLCWLGQISGEKKNLNKVRKRTCLLLLTEITI